MTGKSQFPLLELEEGGRFNTEDMSTGRSGYHVILDGCSFNRSTEGLGSKKMNSCINLHMTHGDPKSYNDTFLDP